MMDRFPIVVHSGDCAEVMKSIPSAHVDAIVCDPPYGLRTEALPLAKVLQAWSQGDSYTPPGGGFGGHEWDAFVPAPTLWKEALRVLKPGGHLVSFFSTRTYHLGAIAIELAGFEMRDMLSWLHAQGMPKTGKLGGVMLKKYGSAELAEMWKGWSTALKPGQEPIVLARKPFEGATFENVVEHGTGAMNVQACAVVDAVCPSYTRWPSNVCHDGSEEVEETFAEFGERPSGAHKEGAYREKYSHVFPNQSKSYFEKHVPKTTGFASRFYFCGKASTKERGKQNKHPTVKPLALMQWLVRLVTPPGGIVLDPFAGSGTTGIAAWNEGFQSILIERAPEYMEMMKQRFNEEHVSHSTPNLSISY